jgi:RimJ/RimL family protein N-acetyltransferase
MDASMNAFPLVTERLVLRPLTVAELPALAAYRAEAQAARYQSWQETYSLADAQRLLADQPADALRAPGEWLQVAVLDAVGGALLGDCALRLAADEPGSVELGVTLAAASQGRGIAAEALSTLVAHVFAQPGVHRVFARLDERNHPSARLFERLGFRREARLVEAEWFKGEWTTALIYARLRREWENRQAADRY